MSITFPILAYVLDDEMQESIPADPTIRSEMEGGAILTRARFTAGLRAWTYTLHMLTPAMWDVLYAFQKTVGYGALAFVWTHPTTEITYSVKFKEPLRSEQEFSSTYKKAMLSLIEATPNSEGAV
jgi:hypothetical protein